MLKKTFSIQTKFTQTGTIALNATIRMLGLTTTFAQIVDAGFSGKIQQQKKLN